LKETREPCGAAVDVESSEPYAVSDAIDVLEAYVVVGYRLRTILTEPELLTEEL